jgi:hypothetical protein
MSSRLALVILATVFVGCSDSSPTAADGGVDGAPPEAGVELGLSDKGLVEAGQTDNGAGDLPSGDPGAASFIGSRSIDLCEGSYNVCKGMVAGCKIDGNYYIQGSFPGERKFLVETTPTKPKIRILIYLMSANKLSPGTETEVNWYEPGCASQKTYKLSKAGTDLFKAAGSDNTFVTEQAMAFSGDHLVTVWSDAVVKYLLRADVVK